MRWCPALLIVLLVAPAFAQTDAPLAPGDDDAAAYCLGVNRQLVERFRKMQLWGCGKAPSMDWCRAAKAGAPEAMRHRERLAMRFARSLSDKGLFDAERPADFRQRLTAIVADGSSDAALCFNENGAKDEAACARLQRCEAAEQKLEGQ